MKWNDIPQGTSFAMSQKGVDELRAGKPKAFGTGIICGAILTLVLQSCGSDDSKKTDDTPKPGPSSTSTHKPSN
jgi:hypothetical protein